MQRQISIYKNVMINRILKSKTPVEVLGIIHDKMEIIDNKQNLKDLRKLFLQNAVIGLKALDVTKLQGFQRVNIWVALDHLNNIKK